MNYKIFPAHKRTICINYYEENFERYSVQFPKTLFFETSKSELSCVALNEQNEPCYMPFFNITSTGVVCLVYDNDEYSKYSFEELCDFQNKIQKFFTDPFKICGDVYSFSAREYIKLKFPTTISVPDYCIPKIKRKLKLIYEKQIKLIKCKEEHALIPNNIIKHELQNIPCT